MYRFEKLEVWKKAMVFCELVYQKSKSFPKTEVYGLTSQVRKATTSIPLNIAEIGRLLQGLINSLNDKAVANNQQLKTNN
ncbi:MAG: hypothetical protein DCC43_06060 [Candidatus Brocadia sp.]|nr:four helix bundle protein [Candidatus Brocadia sp. AMX3]MDG5996462.1 four helix bundle protein [Candidatus Brocadia sp.]RIK01381.1 MAG: hypothetical protein DCC43_06060 [Candidatus Brocadia sp.]